MPLSAEDIRSLHRDDLRILHTIERLMRWHQWVPEDLIRQKTGFSAGEVKYRAGRLHAKGMVRYDTVPYEGYTLVSTGYDTLALTDLVRRGTVSALGGLIGEGKEAVVYEALGVTPLVLKFHHLGERSFRAVRRGREYGDPAHNLPRSEVSIASAAHEYAALQHLHPRVNVPLPIAYNRHVVVMALISGLTLNRVRLTSPSDTLGEILELIRTTYSMGVVHADLSEFNLMVSDDRCVVIDWPQWVATDHPAAHAHIVRDISTVLGYFRKKYRIMYDVSEAVRCVTT
ncbi:MAG: serine/threonine protein phosphatase [Methanomicrobiales archaeon]|jgi:RIO kinase 2|nr:serine/threonine protein phosphatase [Methanomicrobiales archaeon]